MESSLVESSLVESSLVESSLVESSFAFRGIFDLIRYFFLMMLQLVRMNML